VRPCKGAPAFPASHTHIRTYTHATTTRPRFVALTAAGLSVAVSLLHAAVERRRLRRRRHSAAPANDDDDDDESDDGSDGDADARRRRRLRRAAAAPREVPLGPVGGPRIPPTFSE
jgi:hypothetical protein